MIKKRLLLCTTAMFLLGWAVGTEYSQGIFRILAPGMWSEARLTTLLLFSFFAGIPLGCLFASASMAVFITRRFTHWWAQVAINLLTGCLICFGISRIHLGLVETNFGHEIGYSWFLFSRSPLIELPLAAAACILFAALILQCAGTLRRSRALAQA